MLAVYALMQALARNMLCYGFPTENRGGDYSLGGPRPNRRVLAIGDRRCAASVIALAAKFLTVDLHTLYVALRYCSC